MTAKDFDLSGLTPEQRAKWQSRLDSLPPAVRESLQRNLARVPPDRVAKILQESSPMLERVLGRVEAPRSGATQNQPPARAPVAKVARDDYFNTTVQQGDGGGVPLVPVVGIAAAIALLVTWLFGG